MPLFNIFTPEQANAFILILTRVSVVLFLFPVFGSPNFPNMVKAGLAMVITLLLFPVVPVEPSAFPGHPVTFGILMGSEIIIGMILGLTVRIFFAGVQFAGQLIGFQMGFSMINVVDPQSGGNVSIMEQIGYWTVLLIFLVMNGHHFMIRGLVESFSLMEMGGQVTLGSPIFGRMVELSGGIFALGFKMGAPAIAALVFTDTAFGIAGKFAPQMNVMLVAFPVKISVGLLFFGIFLEVAITVTRAYLGGFRELLTTLMVWMGG